MTEKTMGALPGARTRISPQPSSSVTLGVAPGTDAGRPAIPVLDDDVDTLTAALAYARAGWYVLPVKRAAKHPGSVVGERWQFKSSRDAQQIAAWFAGTNHGIALHLGRSGAVAFDVDRPEKLPPLLGDALDSIDPPMQQTRPDTDPCRGHFLFTLPPGLMVGNGGGKLGKEWGEVRGRNGVIIVAPSVHEKAGDGARYRWAVTGPLPTLPPELADALGKATDTADAATDAEIATFMAEHVGDTRPELLPIRIKTLAQNIANGQSRHDATLWQVFGAMKEARGGYFPAVAARDALGDVFVDAITKQRPGAPAGRILTKEEARSEYAAIVAWCVGQANETDLAEIHKRAATIQVVELAPSGTPSPTSAPTFTSSGTASTPSGTASTSSLPPTVDVAGLWERPVMRHIRDYAWSKRVSPLGALGATLARALAMLHPHWQLPDIVVGPGSLNFYCALVGRSGGGKLGPNSIAERAFEFVTGLKDDPRPWTDPISDGELPVAELGSGEGFGHGYMRRSREKKGELEQARVSMLYVSPEIDWLGGVGHRQGSTLLPVLRKAWSGEALNPQFAALDKRVNLRGHSYRVALVLGVQPKKAGPLLDDADGGLPQRFCWMPVVDPEMPAKKPPTPEPMQLRIPLPPDGPKPIVVCRQIVDMVDEAALRRHRGEGDDLDTHALFAREKVAAGLALLDGHLVEEGVTDADWELAGVVMKVSDATRGWVQDVRRDLEAQANRARGRAEGERELVKRSVSDQQELERTAATIKRRLARESDWLPYGKLRAAVRSDLRKWTDDALEVLISAGDIQVDEHVYQGQKTTRYRGAR